LWVALSFRFPLLFDERYHFDVINIFSHGFSPIITDQPPAYDLYGSLTFGSASLFHYLMSFPNRAILLFTNDLFTQVVILRILNILMAASGLWLFGRVFRTIGIKQIYVNISLFFYSLIPLVIFIAATISYDNMLLPLTGGFMLAGLKILQNKGNKAIDYTLFIVIGLFATLVKFTFLPVFVGSMIYVVIVEIRKSGRSTVRILNRVI